MQTSEIILRRIAVPRQAHAAANKSGWSVYLTTGKREVSNANGAFINLAALDRKTSLSRLCRRRLVIRRHVIARRHLAGRYSIMPAETIGEIKLVLPPCQGGDFLDGKSSGLQLAIRSFQADANQLLARGNTG